MSSGFSPALYYGGTMSRPVRIVGQGSSGQGSAIAFGPLTTAAGGQGASEETHGFVTRLQQMLCSQAAASLVVAQYCTNDPIPL
jgi:hypothetical protein